MSRRWDVTIEVPNGVKCWIGVHAPTAAAAMQSCLNRLVDEGIGSGDVLGIVVQEFVIEGVSR